MARKIKRRLLSIRRDKAGRFAKSSKPKQKGKSRGREASSKKRVTRPAPEPRKKKVVRVAKRSGKKSAAKPHQAKPIKKKVLRKAKLPVKVQGRRPRKKLPAKRPVLRRKKKLPVRVPVRRPKKKLPAKRPTLRPKTKRPAKAAPPKRGKKRPARVVPPRLRLRKKIKKPKKGVPKGPKVKQRYPGFMVAAREAEAMMQEKLVTLGDLVRLSYPELIATAKTFINADATVDGELRITNLPEEWRRLDGLPSIVATISEAVRGAGAFPVAPAFGGAFWISFGLRFGPKDLDEIMQMAKEYKRFRGLLQVGAHHTTAQNLTAMLNNALSLRMFIERIWAKRNLPPVQIIVRFVWTPQKVNPGRFPGEEGSTK